METMHDLNRRLVAASSAADGAYYRWAKRSNVTWSTLDLLYALDGDQLLSQKQICEEWGMPKTTVNTAVKACQAAGYITLQPMPGQPRQQRLCLTEAGRACAREALEELYAAEDRAMAQTVERFGAEFVDAAEFFFARFRAAIDEMISFPNQTLEKEENNSV